MNPSIAIASTVE